MRLLFDMPLWALCLALLLMFYGAIGLSTALGEPAWPMHAPRAAEGAAPFALPIDRPAADGTVPTAPSRG